VKVTSPGPIFFRQQRVGRDGRTFDLLKFRCIAVHAERRIGELPSLHEADGALFEPRRNPLMTRVGAVMRRYSVDDLPQLFNVLTGAMSMVGPRPPLPSEVESFGAGMSRRLIAKPGLTGLWHVNGRSGLSWDDSVRLDVHYVDNWSLLLDLMILWRTVGAVLRGHGAY
jgi:lipopolysaccharide/colanic/teichoic acid biosynthesis glycosyltransferase